MNSILSSRRNSAHTGDSIVNEIVFAPATKQLELLRSAQISASELAEAHIHQIERLNPDLTRWSISMPSAFVRKPGNWTQCASHAVLSRSAGHDQVVDCDGRLPM